MTKICVIGWPVEHSLSPVIHGYWLKSLNISGQYEKAAVKPGDFETFIRDMQGAGFAGANVTLPHKIEALRLCDEPDAAAQAVGAVNTLWYEKGRLCGSNTDASGFLRNLDASALGWDGRPAEPAIVVGAGGAARAVLWALLQRGMQDIRIVNRSLENALDTARAAGAVARVYALPDLDVALRGAALAVNASTLGMTGFPPLNPDFTVAADDAVACDIVYKPLETEFLRAARQGGLRIADGLGMLLHQAAPGFEKWFAVKPEVTPQLRAHVLKTLHAAGSNS